MTATTHPLPEPPTSQAHALLRAGWLIGQDLISTLIFAALIAVTHNLILSTVVGIAGGLVSIVWTWARRRPVDAIQWLSVGLVVVFGGAGLLTHDQRFVMIKPTIIYIAVGLVMLKAGWMARYMPEVVRSHGGDVVRAFETIWALSMFAVAAANAALVVRGDLAAWTLFIAVAPLASKLTLFAIEYLALRVVVGGRVRAMRAAA